ncbi:MFS transporter [Thermococcus celericrescens]|uniref:MFS transporter n=1 Tax=Thermococcus celericrescens TaxID=227598 RepID=A0A100XW69_9EURY|nr:MFS transporter [Thermococcus celericrescens]KUH32172.1 MFS transporter [Thermococcus celericrescens]
MSLNRNFWLFAVGRFISQLGWAVQDVALPLYVLDQTHSGSMMTVFILAEMIPVLIIMPFAGVVGDRYNRKHLMVGFDLARGALLFCVIAFDLLGIYQLLVVQVIMASMGAFFSAGTGAMFPDLVEPDELEKANSTVSSFTILARLVGPALGGFIYAVGGIKLAILINAVSFFGSGLFEILIRYEWRTKELESFSQVIEDLKEGIGFLRSNRYLSTLMFFALFMIALGQPFGAVIMPYSYREVLKFSSYQFGLLQSAFMGGALIGNGLIAIKFGKKAGRYLFHTLLLDGVMILAFTWAISPLSGLGRNEAFFFLAGINILWGSIEAFIDVPINSKIQRAIPSELRGRVMSAMAVLMHLSSPLGLLAVGPLLDRFPAWEVTVAIWAGMAVVVAYFWARYREVLLKEQKYGESEEVT